MSRITTPLARKYRFTGFRWRVGFWGQAGKLQNLKLITLIIYSVRFEKRKMDHGKSYMHHQYINKIGFTRSSSLFSVRFNVFKTNVMQKNRKSHSAITNPILLKKKQAYFTNLRKYIAKTRFFSNILFI